VVGSKWTGTAHLTARRVLSSRRTTAAQGTAPNADLWVYAVSYQRARVGASCVVSTSRTCLSGGHSGRRLAAQPQRARIHARTPPARRDVTSPSSRNPRRSRTASRLGYKTLQGLHGRKMASCVRLVRAGLLTATAGRSHTVDGTVRKLTTTSAFSSYPGPGRSKPSDREGAAASTATTRLASVAASRIGLVGACQRTLRHQLRANGRDLIYGFTDALATRSTSRSRRKRR